MDKLKKIYYPILAAVFVIALAVGLVFSAVSVGGNASKAFVDNVKAHTEIMERVHNSFEPDNQTRVRNYIVSTLTEGGFASAGGSQADGYASASATAPSQLVQQADLSEDAWEEDDDSMSYVFDTVNNVIAYIPGQNTDEAVLMIANYDSAFGSQSGTESIQAAALLQTAVDAAKSYNSGSIPNRSIIFLFSDAERQGAYGTTAFKNQFKGFGGIVDNIKLVINFGARGTGALSVETDGISASEVKGLASGLNSSIDGLFESNTDYDVFDCAKINVFFGGNREYINTSRDTISNVPDSKIKAVGGVMQSLLDAYGKGKIDSSDGAYASYAGVTFSYNKTVAYAMGAVALVLLVIAIVMFIKNKKFLGLIKGTLTQVLNLVITGIILYVCYFIIALLLAGFGVIPIIAVTSVKYLNLGVFIGALVLAFAAYAGVCLLLRRFLKIKATDFAKGGAVLIALGGAILAFAMPTGAFFFALSAVLESVALLVVALLGGKFKEKVGADIERLFLYTLPLVITTPAIIPMLVQAGYSLGAIYLPIIMLVAVLGFMTIAPYFGLLKPTLGKAVAKLPMHTIRVEKEFTEQREGAKKGRKEVQEVKVRRVVNEKVAWTYHNRFGVAFLGVVSALVIIISALVPVHSFSTNLAGTVDYRESIKDNSIVYHWEQIGTDTITETVRVYDKVAFSYFNRIDDQFSYDRTADAYIKNYSGNSSLLLGTSNVISIRITDDEEGILFNPYNVANESVINIRFTNVANVTKITVRNYKGDLEIENDGKNEFYIELPYNENDFSTFNIMFEHTEALNINVDYYQYVFGEETSSKIERYLAEYEDVRAAFGNEDFYKEISWGMIFHKQSSYSFGSN